MKVILKAKGLKEVREMPGVEKQDEIIILAYVQTRKNWDNDGTFLDEKPQNVYKAWYKLDRNDWENGMPVYNFVEREAVITYEDFYKNQKDL